MNKTSAKKRAFPIYALLAYLLIFAVMTSGISLAKYTTSSGDVSDSARVAKYVFDIADGNGDSASAVLTDMCKPGDIVFYTVVVNNYVERDNNTVDICEVAQKYTVQISLGGSLPISAALYAGEVDENNVGSLTSRSSVNTQTNSDTCSGIEAMLPSVEQSHEYTLVVSWPESENGLQYSRGGIAEVEIVVVSEQID